MPLIAEEELNLAPRHFGLQQRVVREQAIKRFRGGTTRERDAERVGAAARRRSAVHQAIVRGRKSLNESIERLLMAIGCVDPTVHATSLVSLLDGMVHDQLLHPEIATPPGEVEDIFRRWLQSC